MDFSEADYLTDNHEFSMFLFLDRCNRLRLPHILRVLWFFTHFPLDLAMKSKNKIQRVTEMGIKKYFDPASPPTQRLLIECFKRKKKKSSTLGLKRKLIKRIVVYFCIIFCKQAEHFCSTWMTSRMHIEKKGLVISDCKVKQGCQYTCIFKINMCA